MQPTNTSNTYRKNSCPKNELISPCTCHRSRKTESLTLNCKDQRLGDAKISQILNAFLPLEEKLKVPNEIRQFNHLSKIDLQLNKI